MAAPHRRARAARAWRSNPDEANDAITAALDNYAAPTSRVINTRTLSVLAKLKDKQDRPLLEPDVQMPGAQQLLGRRIVPAPQLADGRALLIDPPTIQVAIDLNGSAQLLFEAFAANDQTGVKIVSRVDFGCTIPAGLVAITGCGPS